MFSKKKLFPIFGITLLLFLAVFFLSKYKPQNSTLTKIAIANWGPHSSLEDSIKGLKDGLEKAGYQEHVHVEYEISHVNFDTSLIGQMLAKFKASHPAMLITVATPVSQRAKAEIKDLPILFTDVTDPIAAGLLDDDLTPKDNITGVSDRQDLDAFLDFALKLLPHAQKIGILFATAEANDRALVKMMESAAAHHSMQVFSIPIDEPRDIPIRMQKFKNSVDLIYVGASGPIQPSLPAIVSEADLMKIPVFNADAEQVKNHQALAAFAVSYYQVGLNTAKLARKILEGNKPSTLEPIFPSLEDHRGFISKKKALYLGIKIPTNLKNITLVD